jgi:hypothetical protein
VDRDLRNAKKAPAIHERPRRGRLSAYPPPQILAEIELLIDVHVALEQPRPAEAIVDMLDRRADKTKVTGRVAAAAAAVAFDVCPS